MNELLTIKDLHAGYEDMSVLNGIDIHVGHEAIVTLIGPNGAGKSTVLKSIFNIADVYDGSIRYRDKSITGLKTSDLIHLDISYLPQGSHVFPTLTVEENLNMGDYIGHDRSVRERRKGEVFDKFPVLEAKRDELAGDLSGGQQQMLGMGRCLMQDPQLLLLDEPSAGLAPKLVKESMQKIQSVNDEGTAVMIVEQNAKQAIQIADHTYVLEDGEVALEGGEDITAHEKIRDIYLGGR